MQIDEFQSKLKAALGCKLEHATPANVREFVDLIQHELWRERHPGALVGEPVNRIEIASSKPMTYETLMRAFFVSALSADRDESLIQLWILALDLAYSGIEQMHADQIGSLFRGDQEWQ